jgi:hypothetical protein
MRPSAGLASLLFLASLAFSVAVRAADAPPAGAAREAPRAAAADSAAAERDSLAATVLERIRGREEQRADSVFKNIQVLKAVPAGRLLRIMNQGWGRALGVSCTHCHIAGHWDADDKPQKQIARDMTGMVGTINAELLPKIKHLKSEKPMVNCTTCHRGQVKPALDLP